MSHLAAILKYREKLTELGVKCAEKQSAFCQEAYIRAVIKRHCMSHDSLSIGQEEEERLWVQLDKWNSVSPIQAALILNTVKMRLRQVRNRLINKGVASGDLEYKLMAEIPTSPEVAPAQVDVTDNEEFIALVSKLCNEMGSGHE